MLINKFSMFPCDRFGIPLPAAGPETAEMRRWRKATSRWEAELVLRELFVKLSLNLGEVEARRMFDQFSTPRRPGRRGPSNPERNGELLDWHDVIAEAMGKEGNVLKAVADQLHETQRGKFGNSADAITQQLKRLLSEREKERQKETARRAENDRQLGALMKRYKAVTRKNRLLHKSPVKSKDK